MGFSRQKENREIVAILTGMVEKYPNMRFHQLLSSCGANTTRTIDDPKSPIPHMVQDDRFGEESSVTLERMNEQITEHGL